MGSGRVTLALGSLFSGYGGLDMAVHSVLGAETKWCSEIEPAPSKILKHHWPKTPNMGDITKVTWEDLPPVDIICGGSPCQDISMAGKRMGMTDGTRSNLWIEMVTAIDTLKPRLVVWENVRGALNAPAASASDMEQEEGLLHDQPNGHLRALGRVLGDLTNLGYDTEWGMLRASDVGAPHHRARIFLIAWPQGDGVLHPGHDARCPEFGLEYENPPVWAGEPSQSATHPESLRWDPRHAENHRAPIGEINTPAHHRETPPHTERTGRGPGRLQPGNASSQGTPGDTERCGYSSIDFGVYTPAVERWEKLTRPAPPPTETNKAGNQHLSPRFAEWMMGLPDGWVTGVSGLTRAEQLKAIGNGVCPQQAAAAIRALLERARETQGYGRKG